MVRLVLLRLLESYFRRWFLYPLPIFLFVAVALLSSLRAKPTFVALGALYVQKESLLATLTSIQNTGFAWVTPAQATVDEFKELIQTDSFIRAIIRQTDLESSMNGGDEAVSRIIADTRRSIWAQPLGNNLIQVGAIDGKGPLAEQMAKALVEAYIQWRISADQEESASAQAFFEDLVQTYQADLEAAREEQHAFLEEYPDPVRGDRSTAEQVQMNQLQAAVNEANMRLTNAIEKLESAKLALAQSESKARQSYRLLDVPRAPPKVESSKTKLVMNLVIMAVVGLILGGIGTAGAALLDSSYRFPIDVQSGLDLPVLAVVPDVAGKAPKRSAQSAKAGRKEQEVQK
jgi:capsular polysaccharide biosynthesis protein